MTQRWLIYGTLSVVVSLLFTAQVWGYETDPIGEYAYYKLDGSSSRTSDVIRSGTTEAEVIGRNESTGDYTIRLKYKFKLNPTGTRNGEDHVVIPTFYFTTEFLEELRQTGAFETAEFKVRHLGFGDAEDHYNNLYPGCDILKFYDIKGSDVEDLEIKAYISSDVPVLGAVTMDFKGKYGGVRLKAGLDFRP